jgi:hypothetical protein
MITASARIKLKQVLESCKNPLYCDTDSIHCQDDLPSEMLGDGLGNVKSRISKDIARATAERKVMKLSIIKTVKKEYQKRRLIKISLTSYLQMDL